MWAQEEIIDVRKSEVMKRREDVMNIEFLDSLKARVKV